MFFTTNADSLRQEETLSRPKFSATLTTLGALQHTMALSDVSLDANSGESERNLVPLVGADTNSLGQECSGV